VNDDHPGLTAPGPPGGHRYLCPVGPCSWFLDVPAPEVEHIRDLRDGRYRLVVTEVPQTVIEARIEEHLRTHPRGELFGRLLEVLDGR
jgi:hypothetical protein